MVEFPAVVYTLPTMTFNFTSLTTVALRRAADLKEKIESLHQELNSLLGIAAPAAAKVPTRTKMTASGRAKIAAAQKARWAKLKQAKPTTAKSSAPKKQVMSAAAKAKISAAAKARWAKAKASGKTSL